MTKAAELGLGAVGGAVVSELLKFGIEEAKKVCSFETVYKELKSTMEQLLPIITEIESSQDVKELKTLKDTIVKALILVGKCSGVHEWNVILKDTYTREVEEINKEMSKFCQIQVQLLLLRNQGESTLKIEAMNQLLQDLRTVHVPDFTYLRSVPKLDKVPIGLDWPLKKLQKKLLCDSVDSLLVSAPPGCGKTMLVTQLCHDADIRGKFEHIFFIVVSSTPNFRLIVQNLLKHNGKQAPTFDNDTQAVNGLRKLLEELKGKGILLVLDDVWCGAESFLDNFPSDIPNLKILATSRFDLPYFGYTYRLKPLKDEDAKALLVRCASRPRDASLAEYEDLLQEILKRCNGFPLVIKVVGASLQNRSLTAWKGQVRSWSKGSTVLDNPYPTLLDRMRPSFEALHSDLKHCFLDMGLFHEDQKIRASVITDIWSELYAESDSVQCMKYLDDLAVHNLLDLVPLGRKKLEDGFYNDFLVTQHDVLRELAICLIKSEEKLERKRERLNLEIRDNQFPDWCLDPMQPINARLLSISTDDLFSSSWVEMDFPNVEALVLNLSSSEYALPSFIAEMKKLKVLIITNHGSSSARLSNFSCLSSLPNLKRIRLEKVSITLMDILQSVLSSLKKLSLFMCSVSEVSYDKKETAISKALSSLQEIDIDYCYDLDELPYWVSEVVSLKTLSITNCNKLSKLPEDIGNLSKLEVLRLCSCITLSELPETTASLSNLQSLDISDSLGLKKLPLEIGNLEKLKKISMRKCSGCELPDSVKNLVQNLEVNCDEETGYLWKSLKQKMRNLTIDEEETEYNLNIFQMF
ncbi:putative disease resistance protein [Cardamine amara subsp. amara]|uniref:Disease resistance protein n=1 Tax=Cardamine amara subsp. amara TaxID=228776 RepID=A0ABD1ACI5_CARAN